MAGHAKTAERAREWAEGGKAHGQAKAQPQRRAGFKEWEAKKWITPEEAKDGQQDVQTSLQAMADAWAVGIFQIYMKVKHAQGPNITSLYPANTWGGEVMG